MLLEGTMDLIIIIIIIITYFHTEFERVTPNTAVVLIAVWNILNFSEFHCEIKINTQLHFLRMYRASCVLFLFQPTMHNIYFLF